MVSLWVSGELTLQVPSNPPKQADNCRICQHWLKRHPTVLRASGIVWHHFEAKQVKLRSLQVAGTRGRTGEPNLEERPSLLLSPQSHLKSHHSPHAERQRGWLKATLTSMTVHVNPLSASRSWNGIKEHLVPRPRFAKDAVTSRGQSMLAAGEGVQLRTTASCQPCRPFF